MALRSGVPVVQAMSVVALVTDNAFIAQRIERMRDGVERGESVLRTAVTTGVFTPVVLQMIAVGEETGALDQLMQDVAEMYEREIDYDLKNLSSQIEPILIVFPVASMWRFCAILPFAAENLWYSMRRRSPRRHRKSGLNPTPIMLWAMGTTHTTTPIMRLSR